jgi:hypothetical protein
MGLNTRTRLWGEAKDYCVTPPVHLSFSVERKAIVSMQKKLVRKKFAVDGRLRLEDTSVVVSVNNRSELYLRKHFNGSKVSTGQKWKSNFSSGVSNTDTAGS